MRKQSVQILSFIIMLLWVTAGQSACIDLSGSYQCHLVAGQIAAGSMVASKITIEQSADQLQIFTPRRSSVVVYDAVLYSLDNVTHILNFADESLHSSKGYLQTAGSCTDDKITLLSAGVIINEKLPFNGSYHDKLVISQNSDGSLKIIATEKARSFLFTRKNVTTFECLPSSEDTQVAETRDIVNEYPIVLE